MILFTFIFTFNMQIQPVCKRQGYQIMLYLFWTVLIFTVTTLKSIVAVIWIVNDIHGFATCRELWLRHTYRMSLPNSLEGSTHFVFTIWSHLLFNDVTIAPSDRLHGAAIPNPNNCPQWLHSFVSMTKWKMISAIVYNIKFLSYQVPSHWGTVKSII